MFLRRFLVQLKPEEGREVRVMLWRSTRRRPGGTEGDLVFYQAALWVNTTLGSGHCAARGVCEAGELPSTLTGLPESWVVWPNSSSG